MVGFLLVFFFPNSLSAIACEIVRSLDLLPNSCWDKTQSCNFSFAHASISAGKKPGLEARSQGALQ